MTTPRLSRANNRGEKGAARPGKGTSGTFNDAEPLVFEGPRPGDEEETVTTDQPDTPRQLARRAKTARFVVSVDHQAKSSFNNREDAEKELQRIMSAFPKLSASVTDVGIGDDAETPV